MQKSECLGCKTSFEQGTLLPLQDLVIELKNYTFPIRDQKHKWILLKTIVSLLNSKGGTIFIGAEDKTGEVLGIQINRKQQDQFKLFIQKLTQKIQPIVDLSNREDIIVHFLPVTRNGVPTDRYLGKIIVKQGDTSKLYCFSQKITLQSVSDKKYDEFQVVYSYKRINMGSVKELSGYEVVLEATNRVTNPPKAVNIFHQGCNPQPNRDFGFSGSPKQKPLQAKTSQAPEISLEINQNQKQYVLQFFRLKQIHVRQKLQDKLEQYIGKVGLKNYNMSYQQQSDTLLLQFANKAQWEKILDYIDSRLQQLNAIFNGTASFVKKQSQEDFAVYQNQKNFKSKNLSVQVCQVKQQNICVEKKNQAKNETQQSLEKQVNLNRSNSIQKQIKQTQQKKPYTISLTSESNKKKSLFTQGKYVSLPSSVNIEQNLVLSVTHLNPTKKEELVQYIQSLSSENKKIKYDNYDKTLQFHFESKADFDQAYQKLQKSKDLTAYGFRGMLRFGINTGQITFENYDKKKYRQFKDFITKFVGPDMKRCEFNKKGNRYNLLLTLKSPEIAAKWLDKFIQNKEIKSFRIPSNEALKMKIDLVCVKPNKLNKSSAKQQEENQD